MSSSRPAAVEATLPDAPARSLRARALRAVAGVAIAALAVYLAAREVAPAELLAALAGVQPGWLALAGLSLAGNYWSRALRWRVLLAEDEPRISVGRLLAGLLVGGALNVLLPARVGDLSRAYLIGGRGPGRLYALGTVAAEKVFDLVTYGLLLLLVLLLIPLPALLGGSAAAFALSGGLFVGAMLLLLHQRSRWTGWAARALRRARLPALARLADSLSGSLARLDALRDSGLIARAAAWSALIWGTGLLVNHLTLLAFGLRLPLTAALLVMVLLQIGISVPAVPARIGVFEFLCVLALQVFAVPRALALGYGIVLHTLTMLPALLVGLILYLGD